MVQSPEESAEVLTAILLFGLDFLRLAIIGVVVILLVPRHKSCPQCQEATARVHAPWLLRWIYLEKRLCTTCGWSGIARRSSGVDDAGGRARRADGT